MSVDHRTQIRFTPKPNAFAALGRGITLVGQINDISTCGLAFEHISDINQHANKTGEIDIFLTGSNFYLADIPCIKVYDIPVHTGNVFAAPFITKRCGVKFEKLTDAQITELEYFLKNHTHGTVSSDYSL
jgi:hypothetical protein